MGKSNDSVRVSFAALTAAVSMGVAVFFTLYSLIPMVRADSPGVGSAFVGVLMTGVIAVQPGTPALVRRFSLRAVVVAFLLLLGVGTFVTGISATGPAQGAGLVVLLTGGAVAGAGFGALIVAGSQGAGLLVPGSGLGRALGVYGFVTMLATALGAPAGVQLGLATSPTVLGTAAAVLCALGTLAAFWIPNSVGKTPGAVSGAEVSPRLKPVTTARALRLLALTLVFLLLAVLFLAYGITSLPVIARDTVGPALTILLVQLGTAGGRWLGGFAEPRLTLAGTIVFATVLVVSGAIGSVLTTTGIVLGAAAVVLGVGVGTAQTIALHTAMRRTDAGRASVVWNLAVDGGLWLGGVLAGLMLAEGALTEGIVISACLLAVTGVALGVQQRSHG